MNERNDDKTEPGESSSIKRDQERHGYYYDDETGYEVYDPSEDEEEDDDMTDPKTEG